jgi:hypothetical protein
MNLLARTSTCVTLLLVVLCSCLLFCPPSTSSSPQSAPCSIECLDAHTLRSGIKLVWCVFSEKDIDGFRIYRMAENDATLVVVNRQGLIPAWQQSYVDTDLAPSTNYRYVLGVVFENGNECLSEPVEARSSNESHPLVPRVLTGVTCNHPK